MTDLSNITHFMGKYIVYIYPPDCVVDGKVCGQVVMNEVDPKTNDLIGPRKTFYYAAKQGPTARLLPEAMEFDPDHYFYRVGENSVIAITYRVHHNFKRF